MLKPIKKWEVKHMPTFFVVKLALHILILLFYRILLNIMGKYFTKLRVQLAIN